MPSEDVSLVPSFKVEVDGTELSEDALASVQSIRCEEEINTASMFVLKLSTFDFGTGEWKFIDLESFSLGSEVKIYMGMDSSELMMVGEITSLAPTFSQGLSTVDIRGYDRLHRLRFGKKTRTFIKVKDSDIASTIAGDYGLSPDVEDTATLHPQLYQNNQSDLDFLLQRARKVRYEVLIDDKKLIFREPKENESASLTLEYMVDIGEFSVELSARYEGDEVTVQGWDFVKKETISAKANEGKKISKMSAKEIGTDLTKSAFISSSSSIVDENIVDTSHAEKLAIARYNEGLVDSVTGQGKSGGIPELRAGKTIEVKGIGRFSGIYYVTSTTHSIDSNGYGTSFKVRRVGV